jgi:hypothetical protein
VIFKPIAYAFRPKKPSIRFENYMGNLPRLRKTEVIIDQNHRFIKKRTKLMIGFKSFRSAQTTIVTIENICIIQKGQIIGSNDKASIVENFQMLMAA